MPNISHIPKENVLGIMFETIRVLNLSQEFVDYAQKYLGKCRKYRSYIFIKNHSILYINYE